MKSYICDICGKELSEHYSITLKNNDLELYGGIVLCNTCSNKIKTSISKIAKVEERIDIPNVSSKETNETNEKEN